MMQTAAKLKIYQGIIQYLLDSTPYTLKNIADLSHASVRNIQSIYQDNRIPEGFESEHELIQLYYTILGLHNRKSS